MLKENTKVKLIKPENDPHWPPEYDLFVGETGYVTRHKGDYHGQAIRYILMESELWGSNHLAALDRLCL